MRGLRAACVDRVVVFQLYNLKQGRALYPCTTPLSTLICSSCFSHCRLPSPSFVPSLAGLFNTHPALCAWHWTPPLFLPPPPGVAHSTTTFATVTDTLHGAAAYALCSSIRPAFLPPSPLLPHIPRSHPAGRRLLRPVQCHRRGHARGPGVPSSAAAARPLHGPRLPSGVHVGLLRGTAAPAANPHPDVLAARVHRAVRRRRPFWRRHAALMPPSSGAKG